MDNIYRGEPISKTDFIERLSEAKARIEEDLLLPKLPPEVVIEASHALAEEIDQREIVKQLVSMGIQKWAAEEYVSVTVESMSKGELTRKLHAELGQEPFAWKEVGNSIEECNYPLGVIMHIGAGNALGISAFSVIEGLMTGNINILKLPDNEGGISSKILLRLAEIEPRLKPYIYVLDVSSRNQEVINRLVEIVNAVVVWGTDEAITAIRHLSPPYLPIIEWGHRLSFAYFTKHGHDEKDLQGLARDICQTDQLYCSSPQCVFYETDKVKEIDEFADRLSQSIKSVGTKYPAATRQIDVQAQITLTHELIKTEEILKEKRLITNSEKDYGIMIDYKAELKASPLFRNIWVMPIRRKELLSMLRLHKGYLQTVGLSCSNDELDELSNIFYAAGVTRLTSCGYMSVNYSGEPHDGVLALQRYVKRVNRRMK
ncbi:acyl-CoA reductase [Candidatus Clostridium stratigraminis]|uniref:Acyl-CoA reductase n=1 Tax=Candidatus Clostridium stratigraminis TaxID=3381661 RepID=A0ABW8T0J3_9CLOT